MMQDTWQAQLSNAIEDPKELFELLELDDQYLSEITTSNFKMKVPHSFVKRMKKGDFFDPLLRQVLPLSSENETRSDYSLDPLGEAKANPLPGLLHKYPSRVLLTLAGSCAINCRYCFRRHFPYADNRISRSHQTAIGKYLQAHPEVQEVILSGGDPLILPDRSLETVLEQFAEIPHLRLVRIHTRLPIVLPDRVSEALLELLAKAKRPIVMVLHSNHAQEISEEVAQVCAKLKQAGVTLLNQTVLLRGVNDTLSALEDLSYRLFEVGVLPYYLHVLDKVAGAMHFDLPDEKALALWKNLQARVPGYLLPRLVREEAGQLSKTWLGF